MKALHCTALHCTALNSWHQAVQSLCFRSVQQNAPTRARCAIDSLRGGPSDRMALLWH